jgi:hypothetical protein
MEKGTLIKIGILIILCLFTAKICGGETVANGKGSDLLCLPTDYIPVDTDHVHRCVSEDGNMKFYSWNTGMGGTCPDYAVLCQFKNHQGKVMIEDFRVKEGEPAWVSKVHSIKRDDGSTYYITVRSHQASSNDGYMWMDAFVIDQDSLRNVSVLDCSDDLDECGLEINYLIADWDYTTNGEGWDWLFEYDTETRDLYVPIIVFIEDSIPIISDKYRRYHFDGMGFVDKGESSHKGLHHSLSQYACLSKYFRAENYIIRVDRMNKGDYRYASWKSSSTMGDKPELIIYGGKYDEKKGSFSFTNEEFEYVVGYSEGKPLSGGGFEHHEFLLVRRGGKVILKDERILNTD